jgi:hypothetical protein
MAQILKFSHAAGNQSRQTKTVHLRVVRNNPPVEDADDFWLEASRGLWSTQPEPINPENSPGRVLSEMATVLGGACLLVLLSIAFIGMPYP